MQALRGVYHHIFFCMNLSRGSQACTYRNAVLGNDGVLKLRDSIR